MDAALCSIIMCGVLLHGNHVVSQLCQRIVVLTRAEATHATHWKSSVILLCMISL